MTLQDDELRHAFESLSEGAVFTDHCPPADRLWAGARGELTPAEIETLTGHLVSCGACAEAWRLAREFGEPAAAQVSAPSVAVTPPWRNSAWLAMAASLVAAIGIGAWALDLNRDKRALEERLAQTMSEAEQRIADASRERIAAEQRLAERTQLRTELSPLVNVPFLELAPDLLRGGDAARPMQVPRDVSHVGLVLSTASPPPDGTFAVEARDTTGQVVWRAEGLRPNEFETFTVAVPRELFPDGAYRLQLIRTSSAAPQVVQEYAFALGSR